MANKKCKCPPEGAPEWLLTFGDMMSLLLTFFILLLSLSEIKKEDDFRAIVKEVKKAFGMHGGGGKVPTKDDPELSFIERIKSIRLVSRKKPLKSDAEDPGMEGLQRQVTTVRPGENQAIGGRVTFEPGSADLTDSESQKLVQLANRIRGYNTKIQISGHADSGELLGSDEATSLWDLSYDRAKAVCDFLLSPQGQINPSRARILANGDQEKIKWNVYRPHELRSNRRVEISISDQLVDELSQPELHTSN